MRTATRLPLARLPLACLPLALAALALLAVPATAAEPAAKAPPKMFVVHVEQAVPSRLADYEATTKEFINLVHQNHQVAPMFSFNALMGEDLSFAFVAPIRNLADVDAINGAFEALGKAVGEQKWADLMRRGGAATERVDEGVFMEVSDASYWPADAKNSPMGAGYYELDFYRVMPGMEDAAHEVAMSWKSLFESKSLPFGYTVFRLVLGNDEPLWVVSTPAKDPVDLAQMQAGMQQALGAAYQSQVAKTFAICRGYEVKRYTARPDLSLPPPGGMPMAH